MDENRIHLRDWFAGQIFTALVTKEHNSEIGEGPGRRVHRLAQLAYGYADILLRQRDGSARSKSAAQGRGINKDAADWNREN